MYAENVQPVFCTGKTFWLQVVNVPPILSKTGTRLHVFRHLLLTPHVFVLERFTEYNIHLSYAIGDKEANTLLFYNMATKLLAFVNNLQQNLSMERQLEMFPETWQHLCHILHQGKHVVYWQGERLGQGEVAVPLALALNGTLILGQEQDTLAGDFAPSQVLQGDIAQVSVWDRALSAGEVEGLASCRDAGRGNVFSLDSFKVDVSGDAPATRVALKELCRTSPQYLVLPEKRSVPSSLAQCRLLNATMTAPNSSEENRRLRAALVPFMSACSSTPWKLWLGVTDTETEGVWTNLNSGDVISYHNFVAPFPYGGTVENCAALFPDGTWGDAKCALKKCGACEVRPADFLHLRGLCFENEHETRFRVEGYYSGRPLFRGYYDLLILWDSKSAQWQLKTTSNRTLASYSPSDLEEYPLGARTWQVRSLLCGTHEGGFLLLSLSACTNYHFMCRSGNCIDHRYRCNLRKDCSDGSDEDDCGVVGEGAAYRRHLPPPGSLGSAPLRLTPRITLMRITAVDTVNMAVTVDFQVQLRWTDSRLTFSHLENTMKVVTLSHEDSDKIWLPRYRFLNLRSGQVNLLQETIQVSTATSPQLPYYNAVKMDLVYPGATNPLTITQDYMGNFACAFSFLSFPFNIQTCSIDMLLQPTYEGFVEISVNNQDVAFTGLQELAFFSVESTRYSPESGGSRLSVEFELHCYGGGMVLALFIPSLFLLAASWASLFIRWEAFLERLIMAISTLLIFYLLRLTLMQSIPSSMIIKLIDIWFFFVIIILFINIHIHIFAKEEIKNDFSSQNKPLFVRPAGGAVVIVPDSAKSSPMKLLHLYRGIILPAVVIVFNIAFWSAIIILR
ncbi:uncharacterized protein [Penaeus vannamei]|uniref:uncharacterized protein n=1 Tax=Penaeus vannamei TaxID=6689 RepID=UPI00387F5C85